MKKIQTVAAPIERVKLLLQCQDEMIKQGTLDRPYAGVIDCVKRTWASEGKFFNNTSNQLLTRLILKFMSNIFVLNIVYKITDHFMFITL